jgi:hypothetical protein
VAGRQVQGHEEVQVGHSESRRWHDGEEEDGKETSHKADEGDRQKADQAATRKADEEPAEEYDYQGSHDQETSHRANQAASKAGQTATRKANQESSEGYAYRGGSDDQQTAN